MTRGVEASPEVSRDQPLLKPGRRRRETVAELAVFAARHKKDVETFTQNFLPLVISGEAISGRLAVTRVPTFLHSLLDTISSGDDAIRVHAYP